MYNMYFARDPPGEFEGDSKYEVVEEENKKLP